MSSATLKTIAQATGFSITTVSRALSGYDDVNEDTRRLIEAEAIRQGYTPNPHARALQGQHAQTLGFIVPTNDVRYADPFFTQFIAGIGTQAAKVGFDLLLSTQGPEPGELNLFRRVVSSKRVDGMILVRTRPRDPRIEYLLTTSMPFVVFGRTTDLEGYVYIDTDGISGQRALTEHFIKLGHRRIAYITPPSDLMFTHYRLHGFYDAMQAHDLEVNPELVIEGALTETNGHHAACALLDLPNPPTAIMTGNDLMAFGAMRAIQERGWHVGADIAVGGFDDIPSAEYIHPGLTTVRQAIFETAQRLTALLLGMIAGEILIERGTLLVPELVVRASSGSHRRNTED